MKPEGARALGRYQVGERIGQGATADVYRAYDPRIDRILAVKILKAAYRQDRRYVARFLREARAAGALSHPNIVTVYDVGEADGFPYIAMELVEGAPLTGETTLAGDYRRILELGLQLAEALAYAHAAGVIHRDIKPSNLMLAGDGRSVKILDFGIAQRAHGEPDVAQTQIGQVLGTPRYMSPEQALGAPVDGRSDLFSVGAVLYELVTGRKAFDAATAMALALQITAQDPPPVAHSAPDCPRGLAFIVEKLLAKRPEKRFRSGEELAAALGRELAALPFVGREARGAAWRLPVQARMMLIMALVTASALLVSTATVLDRQHQAMRRMAVASGSAITAFVADHAALEAAENAALPPTQRDWAPLQAFVRAAQGGAVKSVIVADAQGLIEAASNPALVGRRYVGPPVGAGETAGPGDEKELDTTRAGRPLMRFSRPILYAGRPFGAVDLELDGAPLAAASFVSRLLLAGLAAVTLAVVSISAWAAGRLFTNPARRLREALEEAARGNLDFRLSHRRRDEYGQVFDAFNALAARLQEKRAEALSPPRAPAPAPGSAEAADRAEAVEATRITGNASAAAWRARWAKVATLRQAAG